jgi:hypothetical protein
VDDKLPRRMRAVYSDDPMRLRHELDISDWKLDSPVTADAFTSQKARAAKSIAFDKPVVPQPPGEKPLPMKKPSKDAPKSSKSN